MVFWVAGLFLALIGFLILLITQARLVAEPLTPQELEALRQAVRPHPQQGMILRGSEGVLSSKWNWISSRLFPGVLLADVKINDRDVTLVVDTGVTAEELLTLYVDTARAVGVQLTAEAALIHLPDEPHHQFPSFRGLVSRLKLGDLVVEHASARVVAARYRLKSLGVPLFQVPGFVGLSLVEQFATMFDLEHYRVHLRRQAIERPGLVVPLHKAEFEHEGERAHFYYVEGFLDSQGPYRVMIDTGASAPVLLVSSRVAQSHGAGRERFRIKRLKLGEIELEDLPVINLESILKRELPPGSFDILLGTGLLRAKDFKHLTLDFLAGKLYLER